MIKNLQANVSLCSYPYTKWADNTASAGNDLNISVSNRVIGLMALDDEQI